MNWLPERLATTTLNLSVRQIKQWKKDCQLLNPVNGTSLHLAFNQVADYPVSLSGCNGPVDFQELLVRYTIAGGLAAHRERAFKLYERRQLPVSLPISACYQSRRRRVLPTRRNRCSRQARVP